MDKNMSKANRLLKSIQDSGNKEMKRAYDDMYVSIKPKCDYIMSDYLNTSNISKIGKKGNAKATDEDRRQRMLDLNDEYSETERLQAMLTRGTQDNIDLNRENNTMLGN